MDDWKGTRGEFADKGRCVTEDEAATVAVVLNPLLRALETLAFVARHLDPPQLEKLLESVGKPDEALASALSTKSKWPANLRMLEQPIVEAGEATLQAFAGLRNAADLIGVYRALRQLPKALESLYCVAGVLQSVNLFFLNPSLRTDSDLSRQFLAPTRENTGIMRFDAESGERGGFWLYVPETYAPERAYPLVMALHGGSGTGRQFLWSWLRDARSHGAILVSPTSGGSTWALMGDDVDSPNLARILSLVRSRWNTDPNRQLLTGMSDGGTFSYVSGLLTDSPFTHLAPVAAAFHPMLVEMADAERLRGLPIHIVHGALDWMFPVELANQAKRALMNAGAAVTYREVTDLSHTYPREVNAEILTWLANSNGAT